jgi:hypothetical protein
MHPYPSCRTGGLSLRLLGFGQALLHSRKLLLKQLCLPL